jgi:Ulp1 family protease
MDTDGDSTEVIADGFNVKLTRNDVSCLDNGQWLNDEVSCMLYFG